MADDYEKLEEAFGGRMIGAIRRAWNPSLHPRDRLGRFKDVNKAILNMPVGGSRNLADVIDDAPNISQAVIYRTPRGWEIRAATRSGPVGINITPEQMANDPQVLDRMFMAANNADPFSAHVRPRCPHCNQISNGGFLPGHELMPLGIDQPDVQSDEITPVGGKKEKVSFAQGLRDTRAFYADRKAEPGTEGWERWQNFQDEIARAQAVPPQRLGDVLGDLVFGSGRPVKIPKVPSSIINDALHGVVNDEMARYIYYDTERGGFVDPQRRPKFAGERGNENGQLILRGTVDRNGQYKSWFTKPGEAQRRPARGGEQAYVRTVFHSDTGHTLETIKKADEQPSAEVVDATIERLSVSERELEEELANFNPTGEAEDAARKADRADLVSRLNATRERKQSLESDKEALAGPEDAAASSPDIGAIDTKIDELEAKNKELEADNAVGGLNQRQVEQNNVKIDGLMAQRSPETVTVDVDEVNRVIADATPEERADVVGALPQSIRDQLRSPVSEEVRSNSPSRARDREARTDREIEQARQTAIEAMDDIEPPDEVGVVDGKRVGVDIVADKPKETARGLEKFFFEDPIDRFDDEDDPIAQLHDAVQAKFEQAEKELKPLIERSEESKAQGAKPTSLLTDKIDKLESRMAALDALHSEINNIETVGQLLNFKQQNGLEDENDKDPLKGVFDNVRFEDRAEFADSTERSLSDEIDDVRKQFKEFYLEKTGKELTDDKLTKGGFSSVRYLRIRVQDWRDSGTIDKDIANEFIEKTQHIKYMQDILEYTNKTIKGEVALRKGLEKTQGLDPKKGPRAGTKRAKRLKMRAQRRGTRVASEDLEFRETTVPITVVEDELVQNIHGGTGGVMVSNDGFWVLVDFRGRPAEEADRYDTNTQPFRLYEVPNGAWHNASFPENVAMRFRNQKDENGEVVSDDAGNPKTELVPVRILDDVRADIKSVREDIDGVKQERQLMFEMDNDNDLSSYNNDLAGLESELEDLIAEEADRGQKFITVDEEGNSVMSDRKAKLVGQYSSAGGALKAAARIQEQKSPKTKREGVGVDISAEPDYNGEIMRLEKMANEIEIQVATSTGPSLGVNLARLEKVRGDIAEVKQSRNDALLVGRTENDADADAAKILKLQAATVSLWDQMLRMSLKGERAKTDADELKYNNEYDDLEKQYNANVSELDELGEPFDPHFTVASRENTDPDIQMNLDTTELPEFAVLDFEHVGAGDQDMFVVPERQHDNELSLVVPSAFAAYADTPDAERRPLFIYHQPAVIDEEKSRITGYKVVATDEQGNFRQESYFYSPTHPKYYADQEDKPRALMMVNGVGSGVIYGENNLERIDNSKFVIARDRRPDQDVVVVVDPRASERPDLGVFDVSLRNWVSTVDNAPYRLEAVVNDEGKVLKNEDGVVQMRRVPDPPVPSRQPIRVTSNGPSAESTLQEQIDGHGANIEKQKADIVEFPERHPHMPIKEKEKILAEMRRQLAHTEAQRNSAVIDFQNRQNFNANGPEKFERDDKIANEIRGSLALAIEMQQAKGGKRPVQVYLTDNGTIEYDSSNPDSLRRRIATVTGGKNGTNPQINWKDTDAERIYNESGMSIQSRINELFDVGPAVETPGRTYLQAKTLERPFRNAFNNGSPENTRSLNPAVYYLDKLPNGNYRAFGSPEAEHMVAHLGDFQDYDAALRAIHTREMDAIARTRGPVSLLPNSSAKRNWNINRTSGILTATPSPDLGIDGKYEIRNFILQDQNGALERRYSVDRRVGGINQGLETKTHKSLAEAIDDVEDRINNGYTPDNRIEWIDDESGMYGEADHLGQKAEYRITLDDSGLFEYKRQKFGTMDSARTIAEADENLRQTRLNENEKGLLLADELPRPTVLPDSAPAPYVPEVAPVPSNVANKMNTRPAGGSVEGAKGAKAQAKAGLGMGPTPGGRLAVWSEDNPEHARLRAQFFEGLDHDELMNAMLTGRHGFTPISYDFETSGAKRNLQWDQAVYQVGAIKVVNGEPIMFDRYVRLTDGQEMPGPFFNAVRPDGEELWPTKKDKNGQARRGSGGGYLREDPEGWKDAVAWLNEHGDPLDVVMRDFAEFIGDDPAAMMTYNGHTFDNNILNRDFKRFNIEKPNIFASVDVYAWVKGAGSDLGIESSRGKRTLGAMERRYERSDLAQMGHNALGDVMGTMAVFEGLLSELKENKIPIYNVVGPRSGERPSLSNADEDHNQLFEQMVQILNGPNVPQTPESTRADYTPEEVYDALDDPSFLAGREEWPAFHYEPDGSPVEDPSEVRTLNKRTAGLIPNDPDKTVKIAGVTYSTELHNPTPENPKTSILVARDGMGGYYAIDHIGPMAKDSETGAKYDGDLFRIMHVTPTDGTAKMEEVTFVATNKSDSKYFTDVSTEDLVVNPPLDEKGRSIFDVVNELLKQRRAESTSNPPSVSKMKVPVEDPEGYNPDIERHRVLRQLGPGDVDPLNNKIIKSLTWRKKKPGDKMDGGPIVEHVINSAGADADQVRQEFSNKTDLETKIQNAIMRQDVARADNNFDEVDRLEGEIDKLNNQLMQPYDMREKRGDDFESGRLKIGGNWHSEVPEPDDDEYISDRLIDDPNNPMNPNNTSGFEMPATRGNLDSMSDDAAAAASPSMTNGYDHLDGAMNSNLRPLRLSVGSTKLNADIRNLLRNGQAGQEFNLDNTVDMGDFVDVKSAKLRKENGYVSLIMTRLDGSVISESTKERLSENGYFPWLHRALANHGNAELPRAVPAHALRAVLDDASNGTGTDGPAAKWVAHMGHSVHDVVLRRMGITPLHNGFDGHASFRRDDPRNAGFTEMGPDGVPHISVHSDVLTNPNEDPIEVFLHEQLHAISPALNSTREVRASGMMGFEEGLVHAYSKHLLPDIQRQMGYEPQNWDINNDTSVYKRWGGAYEAIRARTGMTPDQFYGKLLTTPINEREDAMRRFASQINDPKKAADYLARLSKDLELLRSPSDRSYPSYELDPANVKTGGPYYVDGGYGFNVPAADAPSYPENKHFSNSGDMAKHLVLSELLDNGIGVGRFMEAVPWANRYDTERFSVQAHTTDDVWDFRNAADGSAVLKGSAYNRALDPVIGSQDQPGVFPGSGMLAEILLPNRASIVSPPHDRDGHGLEWAYASAGRGDFVLIDPMLPKQRSKKRKLHSFDVFNETTRRGATSMLFSAMLDNDSEGERLRQEAEDAGDTWTGEIRYKTAAGSMNGVHVVVSNASPEMKDRLDAAMGEYIKSFSNGNLFLRRHDAPDASEVIDFDNPPDVSTDNLKPEHRAVVEGLQQLHTSMDPDVEHFGDVNMASIAKQKSRDGKPDAVSDEELSQHIADGDTEIWRGVSKSEWADQYEEGEYAASLNPAINGTIASTRAGTAANYMGIPSSDKGTPEDIAKREGVMQRMSIKPGAKSFDMSDYDSIRAAETDPALLSYYDNVRTTHAARQKLLTRDLDAWREVNPPSSDFADLERYVDEFWKAAGDSEVQYKIEELRTSMSMDTPHIFGLLHGYDAVHFRAPSSGKPEHHWVILDRSATRISRARYTSPESVSEIRKQKDDIQLMRLDENDSGFAMPASPRRLDPPELPSSIDDLMDQHTESTYGYWRRQVGLPEMPDGRLPDGRLDSLNYEHFIAHHMREVWDDSPDNADFGGVAKQNAVERMSGVLEADPDMDRIFNEEVLPLLDEPIYAEDLAGLMYHDRGSLSFELTPDQLDRLGERGPRTERLKPTDNDIRELADDIVRLSNGELRSPRTQAYDQEDREYKMAEARTMALLIKSFDQNGKDLRGLLDSLTQKWFGRYMQKKLTLQKRRDLLKDKREFFRAYSNRILDHWAKSSWHQDASVHLQHIVADEFAIDSDYRPDFMPHLDDPEYGKKMMRSVVRGIYEDTQNMLSESHVDSVVAYRGMVLSSSSSENIPSNKTIAVNMGPLSSWSLSPWIAHGFTAHMTGGGVLMVARIPRERIFSLPSAGPGALSERELVILGGSIEVQAIVAPPAGPA